VIDGMCLIENSVIISHITYKKHSYFITIYSYVCTFQNEMSWKISVTGETSESQAARPLFDFILAESVAHSYYKNKFLKPIKDSNKDSDDIKYFRVEFADIGNTSLNNIFLNDTVRNELDRFIYCIKNFETIKTPLRYLLSGVPGTAKTQIIKAIANECKGKATFMFSHGGDDRINMLFRFSSLFNPCVICIDDIDFLVESRNNIKTSALSDFLQHMDGFVTKNLFVIATTNDKKLVDYAASRPGRFDMILDIGNISSSNYLDLVKQSTNHESIINLFNEEVLTLLNSKRVTGSFIVNLVKQIKIKLAMQNTLGLNEQLDVKTLITSAHKGFYQTSKSETIGFGFDGN
jgi:SpoVK/Ycf46/Vps4 family AAA+-type ATPase